MSAAEDGGGRRPRAVVCVSHAPGAQGTAVGRAVAERLGFRHVDGEIIAEAAKWAGLDPALVADAERRKTLAQRVFGGFAAAAEEYFPAGQAPPDEAALRELIVDALRAFADRGSVVIVSHAGSFALSGRDLLRVLVTASHETRVRRVAEARGIGERDAARAVKRDDEARAAYLKRFHGVARELPTHFDLVVNTDVLTVDEAAAVVAAAAG